MSKPYEEELELVAIKIRRLQTRMDDIRVPMPWDYIVEELGDAVKHLGEALRLVAAEINQ